MNDQNNFNNSNGFNNQNNSSNLYNNTNNGYYMGNPYPEDPPVENNKKNNNLVFIILGAVLVIGLLIFGFIFLFRSGGSDEKGDVNFLVSDVTLTQGESSVLSYRVSNMKEDTPIIFESSDESVAVVNSNGKVTAVGEGTATITASYQVNGETMTKNVEVTVEGKNSNNNSSSSSSSSSSSKPAKDTTPPLVKLDGDKTQFSGEGSVRVCAICSDTGSGCKEEEVCKTFTKSATNQQITVYDKEGNKATSKYFNVTVTVPKNTKAVTKVTLDKSKGTLLYGSSVAASSKTVTLKATISPTTATNKKVTWKSSNEKVAKVDKNGKVTAVGKGTATITVTTDDGKKTDTYKVTVKQCLWKKGTAEKNLSSCKDTYDAKKLPATAKTGDKLYNCEVTYTSYGTWSTSASCKCTTESVNRQRTTPATASPLTCSTGSSKVGNECYKNCAKGYTASGTKCIKTTTVSLSKITKTGYASITNAQNAVKTEAKSQCDSIRSSKKYVNCTASVTLANDYSTAKKYSRTPYTYTCS